MLPASRPLMLPYSCIAICVLFILNSHSLYFAVRSVDDGDGDGDGDGDDNDDDDDVAS